MNEKVFVKPITSHYQECGNQKR